MSSGKCLFDSDSTFVCKSDSNVSTQLANDKAFSKKFFDGWFFRPADISNWAFVISSNNLRPSRTPERDSSIVFERYKGRMRYPLNTPLTQIAKDLAAHENDRNLPYRQISHELTCSRETSENVYSIFNGYVMSELKIDSSTNALIIKYGEYYTSYVGLEPTKLSKGNIVEMGQHIGKLAFRDNHYELDLYISKQDTDCYTSEWVQK